MFRCPDKIRTGYLPNSRLVSYCFTNLLCNKIIIIIIIIIITIIIIIIIIFIISSSILSQNAYCQHAHLQVLKVIPKLES
jgi:hypothetical protein